MVYSFRKYSEFYSTPRLDTDTCERLIKEILNKYSRIEWFKLLNCIAQGIFLGNDINRIKETQDSFFNSLDFILFHRRANLSLAQFLFDNDLEEIIDDNNHIDNKEILDIYLLINEYLDLRETEMSQDNVESVFFNTFKIIHTSFDGNDLRFTLNLYQEYYNKLLKTSNSQKIREIISIKLGLEFEIISKFLHSLQSPHNDGFEDPLSYIEKIVGLDYDLIDKYWKERKHKCVIPFEYNFLEETAIIKYEGKFYVYDVFNLYYSLIKKIYDILFNQSVFSFPDFFGKEIIEPILTQRLNSQFKDSSINILKVQTKKYEYADFGIIYQDTIILFEIKSAFFKPSIRYTSDYSYFMKSFDGKYVSTSGVNQQVKRIIDLDHNYLDFKAKNLIDNKRYTMYSILIAFDESLQCYGCNSYLNKQYKNLTKELKLINLILSNQYAVLTVNELELLNSKGLATKNQVALLIKYLNSPNKAIPFRVFLENQK